MQQGSLTVLISGAGIAGATLAALLGRAGHQVTVVERDQGVRSSGNPVDVRGGAYDLAWRLGVLDRLHEAATKVRQLIFVDDAGRAVASMRTRQAEDREVEVPRADLSAILIEAGREDAEFLFDEMITAMHPDPAGVQVIFEEQHHGASTWSSVRTASILRYAGWPSGRRPISPNISACTSQPRKLAYRWSATIR